MDSSKKVALNTGFLYGKMLITIFISLYSTRIVLDALGDVDYGIFNLIAGVIGMLGFLRTAMTVSTQRYLSYSIGAKDVQKQKDVFNSSKILHLIIGIIVVILLEIAGIFLFDGGLNIPDNRIHSAKIVFQFMIISTFFIINAVPYDASINAHENMLFDAITGVLEAFGKLGIAIWLIHTGHDKLILYGLSFASLTILIRLIKSTYCVKYYNECTVGFNFKVKKDLFKEMIGFAGWNLFGAFSAVLKNQGIAIVLNLFVGVLANAAYGIANQVSGQLSAFSGNMMKAFFPQIVKSEGSGDRSRMLKIAIFGCKMSLFFLSIFAIPLILEMHFILDLWLKKVPEHAVIFCQLIIIINLITQLTWGLMVAIQSVGTIKAYQTVVSIVVMLNIPVSVLLLKSGFPSYSVFVGAIIIEFLAGGSRVYFAKKLTGLDAGVFLKSTFVSVFSIVLVASLSFLNHQFLEKGILRFFTTSISSLFLIFLVGRYIAFTKDEIEKISGIIKSIRNKLIYK